MEALEIYQSLSQPPVTALRTITAGNLKGKSDINPQWRYEAMTKTFGLVGIGWKYEIQKLWTEPGAKQETLAFAQVAVYVRDPETKEWSEPIVGIGGSKLTNSFSNGLQSNDEGYKMAVTDAFSTSLKMIGVAADIYAGRWDGTKYTEQCDSAPEQKKTAEGHSKKPAPARTKAPEPKGGADTPEQRKKINELLSQKYPDGSLIFTKDECSKIGTLRMDMTAAEVIAHLTNQLIERKKAKEPDVEPMQEDIPYDSDQPSFNDMAPVEKPMDAQTEQACMDIF